MTQTLGLGLGLGVMFVASCLGIVFGGLAWILSEPRLAEDGWLMAGARLFVFMVAMVGATACLLAFMGGMYGTFASIWGG